MSDQPSGKVSAQKPASARLKTVLINTVGRNSGEGIPVSRRNSGVEHLFEKEFRCQSIFSQGIPGRVDLGGCPPKSPTDPGLHITRTRFLIS